MGEVRVSLATAATELIKAAPPVTEAYDTTTPDFQTYTEQLRTELATNGWRIEDVDVAMREQQDGEWDLHAISARTALKIIRGAKDAESISEYLKTEGNNLTVTVIQPVFREGARMRPRSQDNPHGEGSLAYKLKTFESIHQKWPDIHFRVLVVDDGCDGNGNPEDRSQVVARTIASAWQNGAERDTEVRVVTLQNAIDSHSPNLPKGIHTTNDSRKGGSVLYGMAYATNEWGVAEGDRHIIVDSDSDLSIHPMQVPSLILPIVRGEAKMTAGSRREPESVRLIGKSRDTRGKFFIETWRRLLPNLARSVMDTNRGFKAVDAAIVPTLLASVQERTFPYQVEMLVVANQLGKNALQSVPVAYIDSEALSTAASVDPYLSQVRAILDIAKRHNEVYDPDLARVITELSEREDGETIWAKADKEYPSLESFLQAYQSSIAVTV